MSKKGEQRSIAKFIMDFFPLQLIIGHLKHNLIVLVYWLILFLIVGDYLGYSYGIPILFYSPEYLNNVSIWSFYLLGVGIGGFIMAFNTYSYIKLGPLYPFLVTVHRPFFKFCKNNALIPVVFILFYLYHMINFQIDEEFATAKEYLMFSGFFILGITTFLIFSFIYFFPLGRTLTTQNENPDDTKDNPIESVIHKPKNRWYKSFLENQRKNYIYLGGGFKLYHSRSIDHIPQATIEKMFSRNRVNTSIFEVLTIVAYLILGLFSDYDVMEMPAGMSIILLMTIILMLFSAIMSWFGRWTYPVLILVILLMNKLSLTTDFFTYKNYGYGLDYSKSTTRPNYSIKSLESYANADQNGHASFNSYIETLNNWKFKSGKQKPKLIIVNTSGGGSRSALWTLSVLQKLDEDLNGKMAPHIQLITGASGGMIGAAYFRELVLRKKKGEITSLYDSTYRVNMGKDLLNRLTFAASTNDIFFRYQKFKYGNSKYPKDRGYAFEEQLHKNTNGVMEHSLGYYADYEKRGVIPTMIFSPTIVNDGRRLLMCSQPLSFLTEDHGGPARMTKSYENLDFLTFFEGLDAKEMRFSSVMRSSSTFPFVMPMMTMPSEPEIQLMDAGIRDNYGGKTMMEFLHVMKDWIQENTSGVIILQIRDTKKILNNETYRPVSMIDKLTLPFGNIYKNFPRTQDFDQEQMMKIGVQQFQFPVDLVSFNLRENQKDRISLSWHLTSEEKMKIENAYYSNLNQNAVRQLRRLLNIYN